MSRFLGQHFLIRESIAHRILRSLDFKTEKQILEIGPGKGALTFPLMRHAEKLMLIEKDPGFAQRLEEKFATQENIRCVHADFLRYPSAEMINFLGERFKVVSNLPYETGTAILVRCLQDLHPQISEMALMFQKEVADRILAVPHTRDFGSLTVFVQLFAEVKKIIDVSPESFAPPPKVWSSVLHFRILTSPRIALNLISDFEKLLQSGFAHRRKMLRQNLKTFFKGISSAEIESKLQNIGANPQARAEELATEQWLKLFATRSAS